MPLINVVSSDSVPELMPTPLHEDPSQPSSDLNATTTATAATAATASLPSHHIDEWEALLTRTSPHYALSPLSHRTSALSALEPVDSGREQLCYWAYSVLDHYGLDRSLAAVAFSMFDRYLLVHREAAIDSMELVALTCVYIAAKVHSTRGKFPLDMLVKLGGDEAEGRFTAEQIEAVEWSVYATLEWRVNPTTPFLFLDVAFDFLEENVLRTYSKESRQAVTMMELLTSMKEMTSFLAEMSVIDIYSATVSPASLAGGALSVAMDELAAPASMRSLLFGRLRLDPAETGRCARRLSGLFRSWKEGEASKGREGSGGGARSPTGVRLPVSPHDDFVESADLNEAFEEALDEGDTAAASGGTRATIATTAAATAATATAIASAPLLHEDEGGMTVQGEAKRRKIQATSFV